MYIWVKFWAMRVERKWSTFAEVPAWLQPNVRAELESKGLGHLCE